MGLIASDAKYIVRYISWGKTHEIAYYNLYGGYTVREKGFVVSDIRNSASTGMCPSKAHPKNISIFPPFQLAWVLASLSEYTKPR